MLNQKQLPENHRKLAEHQAAKTDGSPYQPEQVKGEKRKWQVLELLFFIDISIYRCKYKTISRKEKGHINDRLSFFLIFAKDACEIQQ